MQEIYIFGASKVGIRAYKSLQKIYRIKGFLDNDSNKWGQKLEGLEIVSLQDLSKVKNTFIVVASSYACEIVEQLQNDLFTQVAVYPSLQLFGEYSDKDLCKTIDSAVLRLYQKLRCLEIDKLELSDYNKVYLHNKSMTMLYRYSRILYLMLTEKSSVNSMLEYGGGTGLLSLLALEIGVSAVYYNDVYEISCDDAKLIAEKMDGGGYKRVDYISGDVDSVVEFSRQRDIKFDAVVSYDVLEHIYNLKDFYSQIKQCMNQNGLIIMESGANSFNEEIKDMLSLGHLKFEFLNRVEKYGDKKRDTSEAYFDIRDRYIRKYRIEKKLCLKEAEVTALAFLTRGQMLAEVKQSVDIYMLTGLLPQIDLYYTYNTCDPKTGNWAEHLIDFEQLIVELKVIGYSTKLIFDGKKEDSDIIDVICNIC